MILICGTCCPNVKTLTGIKGGICGHLRDGKTMVRTSLQVALDAANSAARIMASAVTMRRCSWLQSSGLPHEVQQSIQDIIWRLHAVF